MSLPILNPPKSGFKPASERIPPLALPLVSEHAKKTLDLVEQFVYQECIPTDPVFESALGDGTAKRFSTHPPMLEDLKRKARELGLWNMFLPINHFRPLGAKFTNLEYGLMAEQLGKSTLASEACNCSAPDTGNMEVLAKYGTTAQKKEFLEPLMDGKIRSAFLMTEPVIAASDATNMTLKMREEGDHYVLNGEKWWASGAGDTRCKLYIVMGRTIEDSSNRYGSHTVLLVPASTPGITVKRVLSVIGYDHAPEGHAHISFRNCRVPKRNVVLGVGRGFEVVQGRLGPGRIHHAMRNIGVAERALDLLVARLTDLNKIAFGRPLHEHGVQIERVARARIEIDAARLSVLNAAVKLDQGHSARDALKEIAAVKILAPKMLSQVLDWAIQGFGGEGVCQDTPLAAMSAWARAMRIVDGPDEVHVHQLGRLELKRGADVQEQERHLRQKEKQVANEYSVDMVDRFALNRVSEEMEGSNRDRSKL